MANSLIFLSNAAWGANRGRTPGGAGCCHRSSLVLPDHLICKGAARPLTQPNLYLPRPGWTMVHARSSGMLLYFTAVRDLLIRRSGQVHVVAGLTLVSVDLTRVRI
jgi:hypothetical protein